MFDFVKLIGQKKKTILSIVFTVLILVLAINFVLPKKYGSEVQVLIIQNNLNNTDPFLVSKSSEHLGNVLSRVIYSSSFYKKVMSSGFGVSESYFGTTNREQLKKWSSAISARNVEDTGILYISAVHSNREQAELIVESIGYNLKTFHTDYHGSGENVEVKIINDPVTSNLPVKPNIILNTISAIIFAVFLSLVYVYIYPDRKYDLSLLPSRKERKLNKAKRLLAQEKMSNEQKEKTEKNTNKYFDSSKIYKEEVEEDEGEIDDEEDDLGGYEDMGEEALEDDLEIDYEEIEKKGNIKNIL